MTPQKNSHRPQKLEPGNAEFANNAGYPFYQRGNYEMAVAWLSGATQIDLIVMYVNRDRHCDTPAKFRKMLREKSGG